MMSGEPISYDAHLSLEWHIVSTPPNEALINASQEKTLESLRQSILMDELSGSGVDDIAMESVDISRTEKKLDLLISLVSALIEKQKTTNSIVPVKLTCEYIEWECVDVPDRGMLRLEVFLKSASMIPMQLYCEPVVSQGKRLRARLLYMHDDVSELLERYIFLTHRRKIAAEKKRIKYPV